MAINSQQTSVWRFSQALMLTACLVSASGWLVATPISIQAQTSQESLLANLKNPDPIVRRKAAKELGEKRFREVSGALAQAAQTDTDPEVRANALESLGRLKDEAVIPAIIDTLKDLSPQVRRAAVRALVSYYIESDIGFVFAERKGLNVLNPFLDTDGPTIVEPYVQVDPRMTEALAQMMRDDAEVSLRRASVRALGVLRADSQAPALIGALDSDPNLRIDIFRVFIKLGRTEYGEYAIPYFASDDREIRAQAIATAGLLRTHKAVEPLNSVYRLGEDKRGFKANINDFFKQVPERQRITLEALSQIGDPASKDIFEGNLRRDEDRRQWANEGLARMGDTSFVETISRNRLKEGSGRVKLAQAFALYKLGRPEYLDAVIKELEAITLGDQATGYLYEVLSPADLHGPVRVATTGATVKILKVLGVIGTSESIPVMEPLLRDTNARVVNAANLAIQRIKLREQYQQGQLPVKPPLPQPQSPSRPRRTNPKDGGQQ